MEQKRVREFLCLKYFLVAAFNTTDYANLTGL